MINEHALDTNAYPYRSASAGDYQAGSSAGLTDELVRDAQRVRSVEQASHLRDNVLRFLSCRSITSEQSTCVLDAVHAVFAWWRI